MRRSINKIFPLAAVTIPSLAILSLTISQHIWTIACVQFQTSTKNFQCCGRMLVCTHVNGCLVHKNCCWRYQQRKVDLENGELPSVQKLEVLWVEKENVFIFRVHPPRNVRPHISSLWDFGRYIPFVQRLCSKKSGPRAMASEESLQL